MNSKLEPKKNWKIYTAKPDLRKAVEICGYTGVHNKMETGLKTTR